MYFEFTSDQTELRDGLRDLLTDACPSDVVRAAWSDGRGPVPQLWKQLGAVGLLGLLAPASRGGLDGTEIDLVFLLEECGRHAVPGPLGEHLAVAVPALVAADASECDQAISGDCVVTVADRSTDQLRWAATSDLVIHQTDDGLALSDAADMTILASCPSVDHSIASAAVTLGASRALPGADPTLAEHRAALAASAQLLGLADRMIAMATEHVTVRRQFGVPVGSQQAVKHLLASALVALEHARPVVYRAAWVLASAAGEPDLAVSFAKVYAGRAADVAARAALQCHGAIGYSWEHDLHLWMKRAWALSAAWGTTAQHQARVAAAVLDEA
ncbi:acyl-CoA dehydrogenase family protein [Mycolicibacterium hodleri]|uniref:acyl-CoA dehydrogenase family protein n=1 Tax=Mycolicibacterium hodleri TaxID=49897 RepID=UPI001375744A|nr:acyl-CoA dehydrogenase family protein [Mycolicibacterium hodleri]